MALDTSDEVRHCIQSTTHSSSGLVNLVYPVSLDGFSFAHSFDDYKLRRKYGLCSLTHASKSIIASLVPFYLIIFFFFFFLIKW